MPIRILFFLVFAMHAYLSIDEIWNECVTSMNHTRTRNEYKCVDTKAMLVETVSVKHMLTI